MVQQRLGDGIVVHIFEKTEQRRLFALVGIDCRIDRNSDRASRFVSLPGDESGNSAGLEQRVFLGIQPRRAFGQDRRHPRMNVNQKSTAMNKKADTETFSYPCNPCLPCRALLQR
ncbi:MAG: hypothetical protein JXM73_26515 [Anaerolineae bacterium]|nr:hypothetical protein [Anaerolineae bacterium]